MSTFSPGIGLISVGWMGRLHTSAYRDLPIFYPELGIRPRLVHAADTSSERTAFAHEVLNYPTVSTDYHEVLANPEVDVVSVCAPNFLHAEMGIAAANAGKAIWLEKPAGRSADETRSIVEAVNRAGVSTAVGFNYRHAPAVEHLKALIANGDLGRITNIRGAFFADYSADPRGALSWRFLQEQAGSGVAGDLMGHLVDLIHYLVGPINKVTAVDSIIHQSRPIAQMGSGTHFDIIEGGEQGQVENEDYIGMLVQIGQDGIGAGAVGTLEASRVARGPRASYGVEIYGTEGSARWNFERMNELELALASSGSHIGYAPILAGPGFGDFANFQPGAGTAMGYDDLKVIEAKKFLSAYTGQAPAAGATIHDALAASEVITAALNAAETSTWVDVPATPSTTAAVTSS